MTYYWCTCPIAVFQVNRDGTSVTDNGDRVNRDGTDISWAFSWYQRAQLHSHNGLQTAMGVNRQSEQTKSMKDLRNQFNCIDPKYSCSRNRALNRSGVIINEMCQVCYHVICLVVDSLKMTDWHILWSIL